MFHDDSGESSFAAVTKAEFNELMTAMKGIQSNMEMMKMELSVEWEAADNRLVKKMQLSKGVQFKRNGNEKQHFSMKGLVTNRVCYKDVVCDPISCGEGHGVFKGR